MNLSDDDRSTILMEIEELTREPALGMHEFTIRQFADAQRPKLTISQAAGRLERLFLQGVFDRRVVLHNGKRKYAYSKKERVE